MASGVYNICKATPPSDWAAGDYRVLLVTSSYTPNPDHAHVSDVVANELAAAGNYVRKALANKSISQDDTNDRADYLADNVTWTAINDGTPAYAICYLEAGSDAARRLVAWVDFADTLTNGGDFTLKWNSAISNGAVLRLT